MLLFMGRQVVAAIAVAFWWKHDNISFWLHHQVVGTHNSNHQAPPVPVQVLLSSPEVQALASNHNPPIYIPQAWQYNHLNLTEQLDVGEQKSLLLR